MSKGPLAAGKKNYLHPFRSFAQQRRHGVQTSIVRIDQRIVEDQRNGGAAIAEEIREGETGQHGELLLGAPAQRDAILTLAGTRYRRKRETLVKR